MTTTLVSSNRQNVLHKPVAFVTACVYPDVPFRATNEFNSFDDFCQYLTDSEMMGVNVQKCRSPSDIFTIDYFDYNNGLPFRHPGIVAMFILFSVPLKSDDDYQLCMQLLRKKSFGSWEYISPERFPERCSAVMYILQAFYPKTMLLGSEKDILNYEMVQHILNRKIGLPY